MDMPRDARRARTDVTALLVESWRGDAKPLGTFAARSRREAEVAARARWPVETTTTGWLQVRAAGSVPTGILAHALAIDRAGLLTG